MAAPLWESDHKFQEKAEGLATHAFKVMRLYCREYGLGREYFTYALAALCVEVRDTYPGGASEFDKIAAEAQRRYVRSKKP